MFEYNKSKAPLICLLVGMAFLLLGFIAGDDAMEICVTIGIIVLIVALVLEAVNAANKKKSKKVSESLEKDPNAAAINNYRAAGKALEFPKVNLIVTPEAILSVSKTANIIPLKDIDRLYRTNVFNKQYSMDQQAISLDLKSGQRIYVAMSQRNNTAKAQAFNNALAAADKALKDSKLLSESVETVTGGNE